MTPALIKCLLETRGETQASIAKRIGCTQTAVSQTIQRASRSLKIESEISKLLGMQTHEVFPDRYLVGGALKPKKRRRRPAIDLAELQALVGRLQAAQVAA